MSSTHYSYGLVPELMFSYAAALADKLVIAAEDKKIILVYSGMSGVSTATAIAMSLFSKHMNTAGMVYVRKEFEVPNSHGVLVEHGFDLNCNVNEDNSIAVFVDDFVSTGGTLFRCMDKYQGKFNRKITHCALSGPNSVEEVEKVMQDMGIRQMPGVVL